MARAEFDFSAASDEEISLRAGDMINLAPKGDGTLKPFSLFVNNFLCYFKGCFIKRYQCNSLILMSNQF